MILFREDKTDCITELINDTMLNRFKCGKPRTENLLLRKSIPKTEDTERYDHDMIACLNRRYNDIHIHSLPLAFLIAMA